MTMREYSIRDNEGNLEEGARQFKKFYKDNFLRGELIEDYKYNLDIGEINHVTAIVKDYPVTPNLILVGLDELVNDLEEEISGNFKLTGFGDVKKLNKGDKK